MNYSLDTIEMMLRVSAEQNALQAATATTRAIVNSSTDEELAELDEALKERRTWCGRDIDHAVRHVVSCHVSAEYAARTLLRTVRS